MFKIGKADAVTYCNLIHPFIIFLYEKTITMILTYSSTISKTILGNKGWKSSGKYREEFLSMEEIFSVQTPRGTEMDGA